MKLSSYEEMLNKVLGEKGTPERKGHETKMNSFLMGETIKRHVFLNTLHKNSLEK